MNLSPGEARARRERAAADERIDQWKQLHRATATVALYKRDPAAAQQPPASHTSRRARATDPLLLPQCAESGTPPETNRGAGFPASDDGLFRPLEMRVHHLNGTFPVAPPNSVEGGMPNVARVREIVSQRLGQADDRLFPLNSYLKACQWDDKASAALGWTEGRGEAFLQLKGEVLDSLAPEQQLAMFRELAAVGMKATRCDTAVDDRNRIASMDQIQDAAAAGNFSGFKKFLPLRERLRDGTRLSDSLTLGSRGKNGSGKYMRIYDKFLESAGVIDAIRYEVEWAKERANDVFQKLVKCEAVEGWCDVIGKLVCGAVCFLDRSSGAKNLDRCPLLDWWRKFVNWLGRTPIIGRRVLAKLQSTLQSFKHQYGCTISLLGDVLDSMGVNLHAVIDSWRESYSKRVNWDRQRNRDLSLSIPLLLEAT